MSVYLLYHASDPLAKGMFVAFTDEDCQPANDWLRVFAAQFERTPEATLGGKIINALERDTFASAREAINSFVCQYYTSQPANVVRFFANNVAMPLVS